MLVACIKVMSENAESAWICPDCGSPCNHSHCDKCFRPRPFKMPVGNEAGSYFSFLYGPIGYYGLPSFLALIILIIIVLAITLPVAQSLAGHGYQPLPQQRPIP